MTNNHRNDFIPKNTPAYMGASSRIRNTAKDIQGIFSVANESLNSIASLYRSYREWDERELNTLLDRQDESFNKNYDWIDRAVSDGEMTNEEAFAFRERTIEAQCKEARETYTAYQNGKVKRSIAARNWGIGLACAALSSYAIYRGVSYARSVKTEDSSIEDDDTEYSWSN